MFLWVFVFCLKILNIIAMGSSGCFTFESFSSLTHYHTILHFDALKIYSCGRHCNKQFLLFSQCFLPYMVLIFHIKCTLKCCLQFVLIWTSLKFLSSGNGLTHYQTTNFRLFQTKKVCRRQFHI